MYVPTDEESFQEEKQKDKLGKYLIFNSTEE